MGEIRWIDARGRGPRSPGTTTRSRAAMRSSNVEIASPCHENWDAMSGEGARRFCGVCQKDVHNLSDMALDEARALLQAHAGGHLCVRYSAESDGTLRFRDLVPRAALTRKIVRAAFAGAMLAACTPYGEGPRTRDLGQHVIESMREDTVPTADGGCDYTTGPFTTFHLPAGHFLCEAADRLDVQPIEPPPVMLGELAEPPSVPPPPPMEKMGEAMAVPEVKDPFVPCDPKPVVTPEPERVIKGKMAPKPEPERFVKGDVAVPRPEPSRVLMGDYAGPEPTPPEPEPTRELMGKIAGPQE